MCDAAENWCECVFWTNSEGAWFYSFVFVRFLLRFYEKFQEILSLKFRNNVSFTSESFFVFIGLFLLCSVVDKWLEKYGYNRRQDIQQGNTSQNATWFSGSSPPLPRYGEDPDTGWSRGTQILGTWHSYLAGVGKNALSQIIVKQPTKREVIWL